MDSPEDHLEYGYERIREQLVTDLLLKVKESGAIGSSLELDS
jgi:hypothetical protein